MKNSIQLDSHNKRMNEYKNEESLLISHNIAEMSDRSNSTGAGDCAVRALAVALHGHYDYNYINQWMIDHKFRKLDKRTRSKVKNGTSHGSQLAFCKAHKIKYDHYYRPDAVSEYYQKHYPDFFAYFKYGKRNHHKDDKFDGKTVKAFQKENYKGRFVIATSAHLLGVIDGDVIDWANDRQTRILAITQIHI